VVGELFVAFILCFFFFGRAKFSCEAALLPIDEQLAIFSEAQEFFYSELVPVDFLGEEFSRYVVSQQTQWLHLGRRIRD